MPQVNIDRITVLKEGRVLIECWQQCLEKGKSFLKAGIFKKKIIPFPFITISLEMFFHIVILQMSSKDFRTLRTIIII